MSLLLAILLLCALSVARAGFDEDNLAGLYVLNAGVDAIPRCGDLFRFLSSGTVILPSNITLDDKQCTGGTLALTQNPPSSSATGLIRYFSKNPQLVGDYLGGTLSDTLVCGSKQFSPQGTFFTFFRPEVDFLITWDDVVGQNTHLENVTGSTFTFRSRDAYIIINNRCLYIRDDSGPTRIPSSGAVCFPSDARVQTQQHVTVPLRSLRTGHSVLVAPGVYSPVFSWTHRDPTARAAEYVQIHTGLPRPLTLTPSHFVYVAGRAIPAAQVHVGDVMTASDGSDVVVRRVARVQSRGLFNPQTLHGDIVVDGLVVSTYTTTVQGVVAHALLAPVRAGFRCAGDNVGAALLAAAERVLLWWKL